MFEQLEKADQSRRAAENKRKMNGIEELEDRGEILEESSRARVSSQKRRNHGGQVEREALEPMPVLDALRACLAECTARIEKKAAQKGISVDQARATMNHSLEIVLNTKANPRKPEMSIRETCELPHGTGKVEKIAVFVGDEHPEYAAIQASGLAHVMGGKDLVERIGFGDQIVDFTVSLAEPAMMGQLGPIARTLGPRGLMPNKKTGTVTDDLMGALKKAQKGTIQLRAVRV